MPSFVPRHALTNIIEYNCQLQGTGGFGAVYAAKWQGQDVAVKVCIMLHRSSSALPDCCARWTAFKSISPCGCMMRVCSCVMLLPTSQHLALHISSAAHSAWHAPWCSSIPAKAGFCLEYSSLAIAACWLQARSAQPRSCFCRKCIHTLAKTVCSTERCCGRWSCAADLRAHDLSGCSAPA